MNRAGALSLVLLLGSLTLLTAPTSGAQTTDSTVLRLTPVQNSCPIGLQALQEMSGKLLDVENPAPPREGFGQKLHITLSNSRYVGIVAVRITVHGFTANLRIAPAAAYGIDPSEVTKIFDLDLIVGARQDASTDLWVRGFTAVSAIDLDSVTFTDGSGWRSSDRKTCRVVPGAEL